MSITKYKTKQIKLNMPIGNRQAGSIVRVKVDANGIPMDRFWRRRLQDSAHDGCCEIIKSRAKKVPSKNEEDKK